MSITPTEPTFDEFTLVNGNRYNFFSRRISQGDILNSVSMNSLEHGELLDYLKFHNNLDITNQLSLPRPYVSCIYLSILKVIFVKYSRMGRSYVKVEFLEENDFLNNQILMSHVRVGMLADGFSQDDLSSGLYLLNVFKENYSTTSIPARIVDPGKYDGKPCDRYDMIFFASDLSSFLCRKLDKSWDIASRGMMLGNSSVMDALAIFISAIGDIASELDVSACITDHDDLSLVNYIISKVGDKKISVNLFDRNWEVLEGSNRFLHIDSTQPSTHPRDISRLVLLGSNDVALKHGPLQEQGVAVISFNNRTFCDLGEDPVLRIEIVCKIILAVSREALKSTIEFSIDESVEYKYHCDVVHQFILESFFNRRIPNKDLFTSSLNDCYLAFSEKIAFDEHGDLSSFAQAFLEDRVAALTDMEISNIFSLGSIIGMAISLDVVLNSFFLSRMMMTALLAFTKSELEGDYEDIDYRRRLKICQFMDRMFGGKFLTDETISFLLGRSNSIEGESYRHMVKEFQYSIRSLQEIFSNKSAVLLTTIHSLIKYVQMRYVRLLEPAYYLSKGLLGFCDRLSKSNIDCHGWDILMNWSSKIEGVYHEEISNALRDGDMSPLHHELNKFIKALYGPNVTLERYPADLLNERLVDGFGPEGVYAGANVLDGDLLEVTDAYRGELDRKIDWIKEWMFTLSEWDRRECVRFMNSGRDLCCIDSSTSKISILLLSDGYLEKYPAASLDQWLGLNLILPSGYFRGDMSKMNDDASDEERKAAFFDYLSNSIFVLDDYDSLF